MQGIFLVKHLILIGIFILATLNTADAAQNVIEITDSHGKVSFTKAPERVVVLNWAMLDYALSLGIIPVGIADLNTYQKTVARPVIPKGIVDVGSRTSPDLNKIEKLKPDVILAGYSQKSLIRKLSNISAVIYFNHFSARADNYERSKDFYKKLAIVFEKTDLARQQLLNQEKHLRKLRQTLKRHYKSGLPKLLVLLPQDRSKAWLFGQNSMVGHALQQIGLTVPLDLSPTKLGVNIQRLSTLNQPDLCYVVVDSQSTQLLESKNWQQFLEKHSCVTRIKPALLFGGVQSISYLAEQFFDILTQSQTFKKLKSPEN